MIFNILYAFYYNQKRSSTHNWMELLNSLPYGGRFRGGSLFNHELLAVHDVDALRGILNLTTLDIVDVTYVLLVTVDKENSVCDIIFQCKHNLRFSAEN